VEFRCAAVRGCTCGELVEVTSYSDTSLPVLFGGGKHGYWRGCWEVTYSLGVRMDLERKEQRGRWSRHQGSMGVKGHLVVKAQCKSSMLTRRG
jgi:hypothetical protein